MPPWYLKAAAQDILSLLPRSYRWNAILQGRITESPALSDELLRRKLVHLARHVDAYMRLGEPARFPFTALELGTGRYPIVPVGLFLCGAEKVVTVDIHPLLNAERTRATLRAYLAKAERCELEAILPRLDATRLAQLDSALSLHSLSASEILLSLGIVARLGDIRSTGLESDSIDLIVSNNTLEHVPANVLSGAFAEFRRLLRAGGIMSHGIDLSDHFSHFDPTISPYNFLRFSTRLWRLFNSGLAYQNRLRYSDYRALHESSGFEVVDSLARAPRAAELIKLLVSVTLADEFVRYSADDLAITTAWFASRPLPSTQRRLGLSAGLREGT
jgi:hypothetical protein